MTDPYGTTLWRIHDGHADGLFEYNFSVNGEKIKLKGEFKNGLFKKGTEEKYYSNGLLKSHGKCENGRLSGIWILYSEDGELEYSTTIVNGIGIIE